MPCLRCTFLWNDSRNGWSESLYHRSPDRIDVLSAALRLLPYRAKLSGSGAHFVALRINDDHLQRDSWVIPREELPPPGPPDPHPAAAAPGNWALLVSLRYLWAIWNPLYLRGIPASMQLAEQFVPDAEWVRHWEVFCRLLASDGWGVLHRARGPLPPQGWPASGAFQVYPIDRAEVRYLRSRNTGRPFRAASWKATVASPVAPCGRIIDYLRSCYVSTARTGPSPTSPTIELTWFFAAKGAKALPFWTAYGSGNWSRTKSGFLGTGEVAPQPWPWRNGSLPGPYPGDAGFCGAEVDWQQGTDTPEPVALTPAGMPVCCGISEVDLTTEGQARALVAARLKAHFEPLARLSAWANCRGLLCRQVELAATLRCEATIVPALLPYHLLQANLNAVATTTPRLTRYPILSAALLSQCAVTPRLGKVIGLSAALLSQAAVSSTIQPLRVVQVALAARCAASSTLTLVHPMSASLPAQARISGALLNVVVSGCAIVTYKVSKKFSLTVAGVANSSCTHCANPNGTFTLTYTSGCQWPSGPFNDPCDNVSPRHWLFQIFTSSSAQLTIDATGLAVYTSNLSGWNGVSNLSLTLSTTLPACTSWPSTLTLVPI